MFMALLCMGWVATMTKANDAGIGKGFEVPGFELVLTVPVEANLPNPDIRDTTDVWVEMINGAKKQIDFLQMYASGKDGEPLDRVLEAMEAAGKRGVKTRFLLEQKMQRASVPATVERLKKIPGLELRIIDWSKIAGDGIVHAKVILVDGREAYVGSSNFDYRALKHIHETGLRVTDKAIVKQIQSIMDHDWKAQAMAAKGGRVRPLSRKSVAAPKNARAYLVASPFAFNPKGVADSEAELVRLMGEAKEEILIQVMDYYPLRRDKSFYPVIDNAIRAAQARKVKVKLLVSHWNTEKPEIDHLKSLSLLPGIEVRITTIPQAKEGFIPFARVTHSKYMTVDRKVTWLGTSNWTGGYLDTSRNLELVVKEERLSDRLAKLHEQLWAAPYTLPIDVQKEYPKPRKGE
jgi:phosphatidylserine/phosphatidylglycerophosphate/cardiolipin synthase-like enzyme